MFNPNSEVEQLKYISEMTQMPTMLQFKLKSHTDFSGDFKLFSNVNLECHGGNSALKNDLSGT